MKRTSLYAIILFVGSCNMSDVTEKIFDDYVLSTESKNSRAIIGGKNIILPNVVNYKFDSHFLIAKQKPDVDVIVIRKANELLRLYKKKDSILSDSVYSLLKENGADGDSENNFKAARLTAKTLLTKEDIMYKKYVENEYLYWILNRSNDKLVGPLTQSEFEITRKNLRVSNTLTFD